MERLRSRFDVIYINRSGRRLTREELIEALDGADAAIAGTEWFSRPVLAATKNLRAISRVGVGLDSIDLQAAAERDIRVFNTPDAPVQAVAEHALALLLALLKHIPAYNDRVRCGDHTVRSGGLLAGKTIGIVGMGRIGLRMATVLDALGCRIVYFDPYLQRPVPRTWRSAASLQALLKEADVVTLHAAPLPNSAPLLDEEMLQFCKRDALIINTARGSLIDENALAAALRDGTVAGAGLDVAQTEPLSGPLLEFPQVIVTPHVASNTRETRAQMEMEAVENLLRWQTEQQR
jgi:D-3-phosphoglycerate dehydrogenase